MEERIDAAAWQIARAARVRGTIYQRDFDGREHPPAPPQSPAEMAAVAASIEKHWPHNEPKEVRS